MPFRLISEASVLCYYLRSAQEDMHFALMYSVTSRNGLSKWQAAVPRKQRVRDRIMYPLAPREGLKLTYTLLIAPLMPVLRALYIVSAGTAGIYRQYVFIILMVEDFSGDERLLKKGGKKGRNNTS